MNENLNKACSYKDQSKVSTLEAWAYSGLFFGFGALKLVRGSPDNEGYQFLVVLIIGEELNL